MYLAAAHASPVFASQAPGSSQPQPPAKANPEKPETCRIAGTVVKAVDGAALKNATVLLENNEDQKHKIAAKTSSDGRFELRNIPSGRYFLTVYRNGYVDLSYGQKKASDPGAVFALSPGETKTDLLFKMLPAAVISGHILDEDGEPASEITVVAARETYRDGKKVPGRNYRATTDDLGTYRLYGLPPGKYFVSAIQPQWMEVVGDKEFAGSSSQAEPELGYAETYYPGTIDVSRATPIRVKEGDEFPGTDFSLKKVRVHRVRGKVINSLTATSQTQNSEVYLVSRSKTRSSAAIAFSLVRGPDGTFDIPNVEPGSYTLVAEWFDGSDQRNFRGTQRIEVADTDVEGVSVVIGPGLAISGRILWDGKPSSDGNEATVYAQLAGDGSQMHAGRGHVEANQQFVLKGAIEGDLYIEMSGISKDCYVKQITFGQTFVKDDVISVAKGGNPPLEITISSRGARVAGGVVDQDGLPAAGVWVVAVPDEARRSTRRLFKKQTTDQYGKFDLHGLAPGEYKLYSWDGAEDGAWEDADFLKPFEAQGVKIEVRDDEAKEVNLTVIAMRQTASD